VANGDTTAPALGPPGRKLTRVADRERKLTVCATDGAMLRRRRATQTKATRSIRSPVRIDSERSSVVIRRRALPLEYMMSPVSPRS